MPDRYLGKFAGVVVDNDDPQKLCRIDVAVPSLLTDSTGWCHPALPYSGDGSGLAMVPPIGASVWVEWPSGDLGAPPVWSGGHWSDSHGVPGAGPDTIVLLTPQGHRIEVSDADATIRLEALGGASIVLGTEGITIDSGRGAKIELKGATVSINGEGLRVT